MMVTAQERSQKRIDRVHVEIVQRARENDPPENRLAQQDDHSVECRVSSGAAHKSILPRHPRLDTPWFFYLEHEKGEHQSRHASTVKSRPPSPRMCYPPAQP